MLKKILIIMLFGCLLIGITGCKAEKQKITINELETVNNKIIEFFSSSNELNDNFCFNYIDEKNQVVVVGLLDNSEEQQEKFKENVSNSKLIQFVQGSKDINLPQK